MASVTESSSSLNKTPLEKVLCYLAMLDKGLAEPGCVLEDAINTTLQETLARLQSDDLNAIATLLRTVVGQIDLLLLERQLAEFGFDAVQTGAYKR